jgi:hypothetical protein
VTARTTSAARHRDDFDVRAQGDLRLPLRLRARRRRTRAAAPFRCGFITRTSHYERFTMMGAGCNDNANDKSRRPPLNSAAPSREHVATRRISDSRARRDAWSFSQTNRFVCVRRVLLPPERFDRPASSRRGRDDRDLRREPAGLA